MSLLWERMGQTESPAEAQLCTHPRLPSGCQADAVSQPYRCQQTESVIPCSELHNPVQLCPTAALCLQESMQTPWPMRLAMTLTSCPRDSAGGRGQAHSRGTNCCSAGGGWLPLKTQGYISAVSTAVAVHFTPLVK